MVSVSIPVAACVLFCGNTVDNKVAAVIAVKSSDDVEQSCFARTARAQNRNKLIAAEFKAHAAQCVLNKIAGFILFGNFFYFKHFSLPPDRNLRTGSRRSACIQYNAESLKKH